MRFNWANFIKLALIAHWWGLFESTQSGFFFIWKTPSHTYFIVIRRLLISNPPSNSSIRFQFFVRQLHQNVFKKIYLWALKRNRDVSFDVESMPSIEEYEK